MAFVKAATRKEFANGGLEYCGYQNGIVILLQRDHGVLEWIITSDGASRQAGGLPDASNIIAICVMPDQEHVIVQRTSNALEIYTIALGLVQLSCKKALDGPLEILAFYNLYPDEILLVTNVGIQIWIFSSHTEETDLKVTLNVAMQVRAHSYHAKSHTLCILIASGSVQPFRFTPDSQLQRMQKLDVKEQSLESCAIVELYGTVYLMQMTPNLVLHQISPNETSAKYYLTMEGEAYKVSVVDNMLLAHDRRARRTSLFDVQSASEEVLLEPSRVLRDDGSEWAASGIFEDDIVVDTDERRIFCLQLSLTDIINAAFSAELDAEILSILPRRQEGRDYLASYCIRVIEEAPLSRQRTLFNLINTEIRQARKLPPRETKSLYKTLTQKLTLSSDPPPLPPRKKVEKTTAKASSALLPDVPSEAPPTLDLPPFSMQRSFSDQGLGSPQKSDAATVGTKQEIPIDQEFLANVFLSLSKQSNASLIPSLTEYCVSASSHQLSSHRMQAILVYSIIQNTTPHRAAREIRSLIAQHIITPSVETAYLCLLLPDDILQSIGTDMLRSLHRHEDFVRYMLSRDVIHALKYAKSHGLVKTIGAGTFLAACSDDTTFFNVWNFVGAVPEWQERYDNLSVL